MNAAREMQPAEDRLDKWNDDTECCAENKSNYNIVVLHDLYYTCNSNMRCDLCTSQIIFSTNDKGICEVQFKK